MKRRVTPRRIDRKEPPVEWLRMRVSGEWREYWLARFAGDLSIHTSEVRAREWIKEMAG